MDIGKSAKCPCQNCTDRWIDTNTLQRCHSTCAKYKIYKDKIEENKQKYMAEQNIDYSYYESKRNISQRSKGIKINNKKKKVYKTL